MKAIKIILIVISILVIAFFATGLAVKETKYSIKVSINKPVNEVFKTFNTMDSIKKWIPEVHSVKTMHKNIGITGSVYKIALEIKGKEITMTEKIMAYVPNEKVTLFYNVENMFKKNDYIFSDEKGVTTITLNASCRSDSYLMACIFPYFKRTFKEQDQKYLNNFKAYVAQKKE
ncbi:MAG: SRPBCC family protein [Polaribacter sp.]